MNNDITKQPQVMDVKVPVGTEEVRPVAAPAGPEVVKTEDQVVVVATNNEAPQEHGETPVAAPPEQQDADAAQQQQNTSETTSGASAPALAAVAQHKAHSKTPILAVFCALIVAGLFAGLAVYAYVAQPSSGTNSSTTSKTVTPQSAQKVTPSAADVDSVTSSIDDALKTIDDGTDYQPSGVDDAALAL